jgi:hypothetical protein
MLMLTLVRWLLGDLSQSKTLLDVFAKDNKACWPAHLFPAAHAHLSLRQHSSLPEGVTTLGKYTAAIPRLLQYVHTLGDVIGGDKRVTTEPVLPSEATNELHVLAQIVEEERTRNGLPALTEEQALVLTSNTLKAIVQAEIRPWEQDVASDIDKKDAAAIAGMVVGPDSCYEYTVTPGARLILMSGCTLQEPLLVAAAGAGTAHTSSEAARAATARATAATAAAAADAVRAAAAKAAALRAAGRWGVGGGGGDVQNPAAPSPLATAGFQPPTQEALRLLCQPTVPKLREYVSGLQPSTCMRDLLGLACNRRCRQQGRIHLDRTAPPGALSDSPWTVARKLLVTHN